MKKNNLILNIAIVVCAIVAFYLTVGIAAAAIILNAIAGAIEDMAGLFGTWWQILLFVLDVAVFACLVAAIILRVKGSDKNKAPLSPWNKFFNRTVFTSLSAFCAITLAVVFAGSAVAVNYSAQLNAAFGINIYKVVENAGEESDTQYYKSDYMTGDGAYDHQAMRSNSNSVALQAALESAVLLWNNNGALPLAAGSKVGFFGIASQKYLKIGTGSGAMVSSNAETLKSASEKYGLSVYKALWDSYTVNGRTYEGSKKLGASSCGVEDSNYGEYLVNEVPWNVINTTTLGNVTGNTAQYKDAAIMVIARNGGETTDTNFEADADGCLDNYNYMDLAKNEADVLRNLCELKASGVIRKVVVLLNSASPIQLKNISTYDIDACMWTGMGGDQSFEAIAMLLAGYATPSGHLPDTYVYDSDSAPASVNFGDFSFTETGGGIPRNEQYSWNTKYVVYKEGIYVGYRYYETRYEDCVFNTGNASCGKGITADTQNWRYDSEVAYSFGHGLSYTQFSFTDYEVKKHGDTFNFSVKITNTGSEYAGQEVMQIYMQKPYTNYDRQYNIEKSAVQLVGYAKTDVLAPGGSQTLTVNVDAEEMKTYDAYNKGTYILEKGDYYFALGTSAHNALNNILRSKGATMESGMDEQGDSSLVYRHSVSSDDYRKYAVSQATGNPIGNLFNDVDLNLYEGTQDQKIQYLSRSDWQATYPTPASLKCVNLTMIDDMQYGKEPEIAEGDTAEDLPVYATDGEFGHLTLVSMMNVDYADKIMWGALMDETTLREQSFLITYGAHVFAGAVSISAPGGLSQNGPSGIKPDNGGPLGTLMIFPCQVNLAATWNAQLVERVGDAFGHEMLHAGYEGVNAPGANIHRTAYSGRNWEYYSEDAFLSGKSLAAQSKGMMSRGAILFTKHFLLNDQERNRYGVTTWANEQTIRETYARAFEYAVRESRLNGIMSSFNRIGCTWTGRHKGLLTGLLREEWGFQGTVESDAAVGTHMTHPLAYVNGVVAGQDLWMSGGNETMFDAYVSNPTVMKAVREAARRILYTQLHSSAVNGMSANTTVVQITPDWYKALDVAKIVVCAVSATIFAATAFAFVLHYKKPNRKSENQI